MPGNGAPPIVYQPIPRRPFVNRASPEVLEEAQGLAQDRRREDQPHQQPQQSPYPQNTTTGFDESSAAQSERGGANGGGSGSVSRAQSVLNLTSSTLYGIFSPSATGAREGSGSRLAGAGGSGLFEPGTPWGTGAETPARELFNDDTDGDVAGSSGDFEREDANLAESDLAAVRKASMSLLMLQRKRRRGESFGADGVSGTRLPPVSPPGRKVSAARSGATAKMATSSSTGVAATTTDSSTSPLSPSAPGHKGPASRLYAALSMIGRAGLLFGLGMGYGILVSRLRSETQFASVYDDFVVPDVSESTGSSSADGIASTAIASYDALHDWWFLVLWGGWGLVLGTLLPWFDGLWDRTFGRGSGRSRSGQRKGRAIPETDWNVVVRGVGAFAGVVFAMRKLPWASAMQASLTLALANPFLWYILDRSKPGLLLATAVGLVGSVVLLTLNLDLMPNPAGQNTPAYIQYGSLAGALTGSFSAFHHNVTSEGTSAAEAAAAAVAATASRLSSMESAETAIWMLSVLFCSCVCFGNIGRRLALRPASNL